MARVEALRFTLIDYGLPVSMAAKINKEEAYKMIATLHLRTQDSL